MNELPAFEWYDAWLLLAVISLSAKCGGATVEAIGGALEALEICSLTPEQLEPALLRLILTGVIRKSPDGYAPTRRSLSFWTRNCAAADHISDEARLLGSWMGQQAQ